jgi:hypothetical protein
MNSILELNQSCPTNVNRRLHWSGKANIPVLHCQQGVEDRSSDINTCGMIAAYTTSSKKIDFAAVARVLPPHLTDVTQVTQLFAIN